MAATKMFRLNAWQVGMRTVPGGELTLMTETPQVQRVGEFPTLDAAMKAAAFVEADLGVLAEIPFGPMLGEGRKWTYNPATRQLGREADTGVWLFGIKTIVVRPAAATKAEAAKAAKAHEAEMAARRAATKANWKHGEALTAALSGEAAVEARSAAVEKEGFDREMAEEAALEALAAKAEADLPL